MVDQEEQNRRYESAKRAAKTKADAEARKRQAVTERLRAIRMARESQDADAGPRSPRKA